MKDQTWATKIVATVFTGAALALSLWIFQTVQKHETILQKQESAIHSLEEKINEIKEYIKEMRVDMKELRKQADRNNVKVGQL